MKKRGKAKHRPRKPAPVPTSSARYISAPQVLERYGGRSHMWLVRKIQTDPRFPKPTYFGRLRFFELAELEAYERACAAARRPNKAPLIEQEQAKAILQRLAALGRDERIKAEIDKLADEIADYLDIMRSRARIQEFQKESDSKMEDRRLARESKLAEQTNK